VTSLGSYENDPFPLPPVLATSERASALGAFVALVVLAVPLVSLAGGIVGLV